MMAAPAFGALRRHPSGALLAVPTIVRYAGR